MARISQLGKLPDFFLPLIAQKCHVVLVKYSIYQHYILWDLYLVDLIRYKEGCRLSATYDLWLKVEP